MLNSRKDKLVAGDDSPSGVAKYMVKDLRFANDIAEATGTAAVSLPALRAAFDEIAPSAGSATATSPSRAASSPSAAHLRVARPARYPESARRPAGRPLSTGRPPP